MKKAINILWVVLFCGLVVNSIFMYQKIDHLQKTTDVLQKTTGLLFESVGLLLGAASEANIQSKDDSLVSRGLLYNSRTDKFFDIDTVDRIIMSSGDSTVINGVDYFPVIQ